MKIVKTTKSIAVLIKKTGHGRIAIRYLKEIGGCNIDKLTGDCTIGTVYYITELGSINCVSKDTFKFKQKLWNKSTIHYDLIDSTDLFE